MLKILATPSFENLASRLFEVSIILEETDSLLRHRYVAGRISWGDGSPDEVITKQAIAFGSQTSEVSYSKSYLPGKYMVQVTANNFRSPTPDTDLVIIFVDSTEVVLPESEPSLSLVVGPILPRDAGFPNPQQWNFDIGQNMVTTESAIRTLLSVSKGERLMDPEFGTGLGRILFEPYDGTGTVEAMVREEIMLAVSKYASSVMIQSISVSRLGDMKKVNVDIQFVTQPKQETFQVNLKFER